ncbi:hypothetical protein EYZ11_008109 [Aspergillus tanneri]|uniref:Uncharacterized protein n=1 Tax=Aspergillus tanneri TaxID=1220188 RepID=A0A4S3JBA5_9EURO|nr:hypothetical protein EYZ11_008109 [Aspergillus tanneri]
MQHYTGIDIRYAALDNTIANVPGLGKARYRFLFSPGGKFTQVFVTNITLLDTVSSPRHEEEHIRLQHRLQRSRGKWDSVHPRQRLLTALHGFTKYKERNLVETKRWRDLYKQVSKRQRSLVESTVHYTRKLNAVEHLLEINEQLAKAIVTQGLQFYNVSRSELDEFIRQQEQEGQATDRTSVSQAMKHFVRDWAEEGSEERQEAFPCVLSTLERIPRTSEQPLRVLVPGAGVGRLAHEIDGLRGFEVTMNEWSAYMNLVYRYMSSISTPNSEAFHPYIDWWSHHATTRDLQRSVAFPDRVIDPSSVLLVEGDFTTVFAEDTGKYDMIVTLFFIDTARNLVSYFETIHQLLRPGGRWINLGPLLYGSAPFLQLSLDEIIALSEKIGFQFEETDPSCGDITLTDSPVRGLEVAYGRNGRGLSKNAYQAQFWQATKL